MPKQPAVYIVGNGRNGTLYVGVTFNLIGRVHQHRAKEIEGFTKRYDVARLVWFGIHELIETAMLRGKRLKNWRRAWKLGLIETSNPLWRDLAEDTGFDSLPSSRT